MQNPTSNWTPASGFAVLRCLVVALAVILVVGVVSATPVGAAEGDSVAGDQGEVLQELAELAANNRLQFKVSDGAGISASYEEVVPAVARGVVESVLDQFDSVLDLPPGTVQIAVGWQPQSSLGVGGPVLIERGGAFYPAAVADARFGGHHARGPVDGFVSMGSNQPWYFGSDSDVPSDRYDFRSAFAHELVHALGFTVETRLDSTGSTVLSGRTEQLDRSLYSQGHRLIDLGPAQQSTAFRKDDVWVDIGGGRLFPLRVGAAGGSHLGNAISLTDSEPGALMYAGLINGVRHELDGPVIGALAQLGFKTASPPAQPHGVEVDGTSVRWSIDLGANAPPPETVRVVLLRGGAVLETADLPGAVERFSIPSALKPQAVQLLAVSASGSVASVEVTVDGHAMKSAATLDQLVTSADYRAEFGDVLRLYWAFFNREPDIAGAKYWIELYRSGVSLDRIAGAFANSGEFRGRYGGLDNERYLQVIYTNILGRVSDGAGFAYWFGLLSSGRLDRGSVVRWIAMSPEFRAAHPY
ncbi:MAG: DUF4214 domain-containing protein [Acidimicrobiales bacterium]